MGGNEAPSTAENADVSTKPRHRRRDGYFWQLLILRIPLAIFAVAIIAYLVHYVNKWQGAVREYRDGNSPAYSSTSSSPKDAREQSGLALSMASVSLVVAVYETVAYLVPRYPFGPRPMGPFTIFFDLLALGLGCPGWLYFAMAEYYSDSNYTTPWGEDQDRAMTMVVVFWVFHVVMCIVGCSACCGCCGCGSKKAKKAAVTPQPIRPAQPQDLEQGDATAPLPNYKASTGLEEIEPATNIDEPPSYPDAIRLPPYAKA